MQLRHPEEIIDAGRQDELKGCAADSASLFVAGQGLPNPSPSALDERLCFGVLCERHGQCVRYLSIDGAMGSSVDRIGTCRDMAGRYPLFVDSDLVLAPD
jgi:hypothetical protein